MTAGDAILLEVEGLEGIGVVAVGGAADSVEVGVLGAR